AAVLLRPERRPGSRDSRLLTGNGEEPDGPGTGDGAPGARSDTCHRFRRPARWGGPNTRPVQEAPAVIEPQVRAQFAEIADDEPALSRVDVEVARARGRARLRWRRTCVAGSSVLAAVAAVALAVAVVGPPGPAAGPPAAGPAAPRQFDPLVPYVSFGWLPAGNSLVAGDARPEVVSLTAGHTADS